MMKINRNYEECVFELFTPRNKIYRCTIQYSYMLKYSMFDVNSQCFKYEYPVLVLAKTHTVFKRQSRGGGQNELYVSVSSWRDHQWIWISRRHCISYSYNYWALNPQIFLLINPATQAQNQGYELIHPNIHPDYDPLEHKKGLFLQTWSCRISITQGNCRITKRSSSEGPASIA